MKILLTILVIAFTFATKNVSAAVWEDTNSWSIDYENKFTTWMGSTAVREGMFTDRSSPYYGVNTDCADTAYAMRAILLLKTNSHSRSSIHLDLVTLVKLLTTKQTSSTTLALKTKD